MTNTRGAMVSYNGVIYEFTGGPDHTEFDRLTGNSEPIAVRLTSRRIGSDGEKTATDRTISVSLLERDPELTKGRINFEGSVDDPDHSVVTNEGRPSRPITQGLFWLHNDGTGTILSVNETPFLL